MPESAKVLTGEETEAREEVARAALEQKERTEAVVRAEDLANKPAPRVDRSGTRGLGILTRAGALPSKAHPSTGETPSDKAARARKMLADGFQISAEMQECIRVDDQFEEQRADEREARGRAFKARYEASLDGYEEAQAELIQTAVRLVAEFEAMRARRNAIESAYRQCGLLDVEGLSTKPPRISERIVRREDGFGEHRYLFTKINALPIGEV